MNTRKYNLIAFTLFVVFMLTSPMVLGAVSKIDFLSELFELDSHFTLAINVLKVLIATSTLLFGIYFYFSKFRNEKEILKPYLVIIIGALLMIFSLGPSVTAYIVVNKIKTESELVSDEMLEKWKAAAISDQCEENNNNFIAKLYYKETGEQINYLNKEGIITKYFPSEKDKKERQAESVNEKEYKNAVSLVNKIFYYKISTVILTLVVWFVTLLFVPPKTIEIKNS